MKISKIIMIVFLGVVTLFATVSCAETNVLNTLLRTTTTFKDTSITYSSNALETEDGLSTKLQLELSDTNVMLLADTQNDLITFNELRLQIIDLHEQIVSERESIKETATSIRETVQTLKDMNYVLLEDDVATLKTNIADLKTMRQNLIETRGDAYQRIYDLRGSYTRENLANIITVYQEVIEVLEYRLSVFQDAHGILQNAESLLNDYLES